MTLTEFLLARIAEDEMEASSAADFPYRIQSTPWGTTFGIVADRPDSRADHWLCIDPARVLAECEAKRRIIEVLADDLSYEADLRENDLLGYLATVYADHPDYREKWKP